MLMSLIPSHESLITARSALYRSKRKRCQRLVPPQRQKHTYEESLNLAPESDIREIKSYFFAWDRKGWFDTSLENAAIFRVRRSLTGWVHSDVEMIKGELVNSDLLELGFDLCNEIGFDLDSCIAGAFTAAEGYGYSFQAVRGRTSRQCIVPGTMMLDHLEKRLSVTVDSVVGWVKEVEVNV
jgi:hypothetical protein